MCTQSPHFLNKSRPFVPHSYLELSFSPDSFMAMHFSCFNGLSLPSKSNNLNILYKGLMSTEPFLWVPNILKNSSLSIKKMLFSWHLIFQIVHEIFLLFLSGEQESLVTSISQLQRRLHQPIMISCLDVPISQKSHRLPFSGGVRKKSLCSARTAWRGEYLSSQLLTITYLFLSQFRP